MEVDLCVGVNLETRFWCGSVERQVFKIMKLCEEVWLSGMGAMLISH